MRIVVTGTEERLGQLISAKLARRGDDVVIGLIDKPWTMAMILEVWSGGGARPHR